MLLSLAPAVDLDLDRDGRSVRVATAVNDHEGIGPERLEAEGRSANRIGNRER